MCTFCSISTSAAIPYFAFNLQSREEKAAYVAAIESQREPFEELWIPTADDVILGMGDAAAAAIELHLDKQAALDTIMDSASLQQLYGDFFGDVIPHFASETFGGLKSWLPPLRKDEADLWVQLAQQFTDEHMPRLAALSNETIRDLVEAVIDGGIEEGLSMRDMGIHLREEWPAYSRYEAERIIRTESIGASNFGGIEGARATGLPLKKEWIATSGNRTRDSHRIAAQQEPVPLDDPFVVGDETAMYPGDPGLSAGERIHCRCTTGFIVVAT